MAKREKRRVRAAIRSLEIGFGLRNPVARALRYRKPKVVPSGKLYRREKTDEAVFRGRRVGLVQAPEAGVTILHR